MIDFSRLIDLSNYAQFNELQKQINEELHRMIQELDARVQALEAEKHG